MIFANFFGAGFLNDAFQVAFRIPNVLRDLFAEGALSAAFVKVFTDYQILKSEEEAWKLASLVSKCACSCFKPDHLDRNNLFTADSRIDRRRIFA